MAHGRGLSMRRVVHGFALSVLAVAMVAAAGISAQAKGELSRGKSGITPVRPRFFGASNSVLDFHGGTIMKTNTTFAIYWAPRGSTWQSGYMGDINGYFRNVAADSGSGDNVYSTETQYYG